MVSGTPLTQATAAHGTDERELVERARAGDELAREQLVRLYLDDVYRVAYRVLGRRDPAQDATQDAFINALNALPRFRGEASFRTWLLRIAVNAAKSHARRQGRWRRHDAGDVAVEVVSADASGDVEVQAEAARVARTLEQLPLKQRLAVTLRIQGLSYAEIAQATESTEGAARVNYHLGIRKLRELLQ